MIYSQSMRFVHAVKSYAGMFCVNGLRFFFGNDTLAFAMPCAMKNGQICFSLQKFLAISLAMQKSLAIAIAVPWCTQILLPDSSFPLVVTRSLTYSSTPFAKGTVRGSSLLHPAAHSLIELLLRCPQLLDARSASAFKPRFLLANLKS